MQFIILLLTVEKMTYTVKNYSFVSNLLLLKNK